MVARNGPKLASSNRCGDAQKPIVSASRQPAQKTEATTHRSRKQTTAGVRTMGACTPGRLSKHTRSCTSLTSKGNTTSAGLRDASRIHGTSTRSGGFATKAVLIPASSLSTPLFPAQVWHERVVAVVWRQRPGQATDGLTRPTLRSMTPDFRRPEGFMLRLSWADEALHPLPVFSSLNSEVRMHDQSIHMMLRACFLMFRFNARHLST